MKIPETISKDEFYKVIEHIHKTYPRMKAKQYILAFSLGFLQCMRISEVEKLERPDADAERGFIFIRQGKGNKDRHIPIFAEIRPLLKYLPVDPNRRSLERHIKRLGKEILGKDIHYHSLRHSGATWLLNELKWDSRHVQQFLGHSSLSTTQIYTHVTPNSLKKLVEVYEHG